MGDLQPRINNPYGKFTTINASTLSASTIDSLVLPIFEWVGPSSPNPKWPYMIMYL